MEPDRFGSSFRNENLAISDSKNVKGSQNNLDVYDIYIYILIYFAHIHRHIHRQYSYTHTFDVFSFVFLSEPHFHAFGLPKNKRDCFIKLYVLVFFIITKASKISYS